MTIFAHDDGRSGADSGLPATRDDALMNGTGDRLEELPDLPELRRIVLRAQTGDLEAQSALICRYRHRLAGLIRPMVRPPDAVEDLVQAVSIKMVRYLGSLREPERFETWLFTLARNVARDHLRRLRCRPVTTVDDVLWQSYPDPAAEERSHELREALEVALRGSPARERRMLEQVIAGSSYRAIASREGVSIGALKVRLHRLRLLLRVRVRQVAGECQECADPAARGAWRTVAPSNRDEFAR